jgi:hypothetical protein
MSDDTTGRIERRSAQRETGVFPAEGVVTRHLGRLERFATRLVDRSRAGCSFFAPWRLPIGERVVLLMDFREDGREWELAAGRICYTMEPADDGWCRVAVEYQAATEDEEALMRRLWPEMFLDAGVSRAA